MSLMAWEDSYSVQIPIIDEQHKKLFTLINQLHDAMSKGKGNDVMGRVISELVSYTKTHFGMEEKLMQSKNYPDLKAHQAQHRKFVEKVEEFQKEFAQGKITVSNEVMLFSTRLAHQPHPEGRQTIRQPAFCQKLGAVEKQPQAGRWIHPQEFIGWPALPAAPGTIPLCGAILLRNSPSAHNRDACGRPKYLPVNA